MAPPPNPTIAPPIQARGDQVDPKLAPKIQALQEAMTRSLEKDHPKGVITTRTENGPLGFVVVVAAVERAYPGTGVARVLLDPGGVSYGRHGERDFADLARERKWETNPPDIQTLVRIADYCFFDGVIMRVDDPSPKIERSSDAWQLVFYRTWMPSGGTGEVRITVKKSGKAELSMKTLR